MFLCSTCLHLPLYLILLSSIWFPLLLPAGRTGRAGRSGTVTSFLTMDCRIAGELKRLLQEARQPVPYQLEKFGNPQLDPSFALDDE